MSITIGYADFVRLFRIEKPNFAPGLELRDDGVYVRSLSDLTNLISPEERAILTEHPTGNLAEPVLALPCDIKELETFAGLYSLDCAIAPFDLLKLVERRAFEQASIKAQEEGNYHWPIVARLYGLKHQLEQSCARESNDSKKVVLRDVLDRLGTILASADESTGAATLATGHNKWPWGTYETELLRWLADAAERFWTRYDPDDKTTAPKNEDVAAWLKEKGASANIASAMATILRSDGLPVGPRT